MQQAVILAIISQKGGVGKSTIASNFAIALAHEGRRVCLIDLDENQYSSGKIFARREQNRILPKVEVMAMRSEMLEQKISEIGKNFDVIIIESGGRIASELKIAIRLADQIVMPLQPSEIDSDTIPDVEKVIEDSGRHDVPALIIPNRVSFYQKAGLLNFKKDSNALVGLLKLQPHLKYFKFTENYIKNRDNIYPRAAGRGKAIFELEPLEVNDVSKIEGAKSIEKAVVEFEKVYNEVFYGEQQ